MAKPIDPRDPSKVLLNIYSTLSSPNVVNNIPNTNILYGDGLFVKAENSQSIFRGTGSYIKLRFKRVVASTQTITYTDIATINYNTQDGHQTYHVTSPSITSGSVYLEIIIFLIDNGTTNFDSIFSQFLPTDARGKEMDISFDWYGLNQETGKEVGIKNIMMINKTTSDTGDFSFNAVYSPIAVGRDINSDTSADLLGECIQFSRDRICDVNVNINVEGYNEKLVYEIPFFNNISQQYSINQCVRYADLDMSKANIVGGCVIFYKTTDNNALGYVGRTIGTSGGTNVTIDADIYSSYGRLLYSQPIDYIGNAAFMNRSSLTSVTLPNSVTSIGYEAFGHCSSLTSITIPNSVTIIGERAFQDCSGLTSVIIGNSVTSIGGLAFYDCSSLTSVTIPNSVTSIGNQAFELCYGLTSVTIGNSVTSIGNLAFEGCGLTTVTIPNSVTSIGSGAFQDCSGLTSVIIGNSVTSIGNMAFYGCTSMTSVIYNGVTYTSKSLLESSLTNNGVSVGAYAFNYTGLQA